MKQYSYPLDLSWSTDEMTTVLYFLNQVEKAYEDKVAVKAILAAYQDFKGVVKSKAEEKRLDKAFEQASGYSTYRAIKSAREKEKGFISLEK